MGMGMGIGIGMGMGMGIGVGIEMGMGDRDRDGVRASGRARVVTCRVVGASGATLALTRGSGPARVRPRVRV